VINGMGLGLCGVMSGVGAITFRTTHPWFHPLIGAHCTIKVAGEVSLTATRLAEYRCEAVDRQHVKYVAVVVLEDADWYKDAQRRRVRRRIISGDAPTILPLISTCVNSAVGFMHDVRVCSGCMRVNGVNGVCCAVVWLDGG